MYLLSKRKISVLLGLITLISALVLQTGCGRKTNSLYSLGACGEPHCALLAWDPVSDADLAGYKIYVGTAPGTYGAPYVTGLAPRYAVTKLEPGVLYYFVVTAYDLAGNESGYSEEVSALMR